jgi:hypothetical protein
MSNISNFTKRPLIFIICKLFDAEFSCNNRGLLDTHKKHSKYKEFIIWCFSSKKIENLGWFDGHESFMACKYDAM